MTCIRELSFFLFLPPHNYLTGIQLVNLIYWKFLTNYPVREGTSHTHGHLFTNTTKAESSMIFLYRLALEQIVMKSTTGVILIIHDLMVLITWVSQVLQLSGC